MKTIYFIRHAKSSWSHASLRDFDRPLNDRGKRDAPRMADHLKSLNVEVDAIISSPANRAQTTARVFQKTLEIPEQHFHLEKNIYEAYIGEVFDIVQEVSDEYNTVLFFGHNPAFTGIANVFTESFIPNVPTCGIAKVVCDISSWEDFGEGKGELKAFYYPKMLD